MTIYFANLRQHFSLGVLKSLEDRLDRDNKLAKHNDVIDGLLFCGLHWLCWDDDELANDVSEAKQ